MRSLQWGICDRHPFNLPLDEQAAVPVPPEFVRLCYPSPRSVTAPKLLEETSLAYFANTPRV
jgi:hypothetical protein